MRKLLLLVLLIPFISVGQKVYLIGDAGEPKNPDKNLELLSSKLKGASSDDVLIFLGDNLYPKGLPGKEHPDRQELENKLTPQLDLMKSFAGKSYIVPGNHDWAQGRSYGWERAVNMHEFVQEYLQRDDAYLPRGGCPGPVEVELGPELALIILNTQYLLHPWDKPGVEDDCEIKSSIEALNELRSAMQRQAGKHIILAAHHPAYTYGEHNGNFPLKEHVFPFTVVNKNLFIPLPVVGSIHPLFRKAIGTIQDNTHPKYKAIMKEIISAMSETDNVIFASGHEHSLQLIQRDGHHFIVSGSGSKTTHLKKGKSVFGKSEQGFAELNLSSDGKAAVKFWGVEGGLLYEGDLYSKSLGKEEEQPKADISFEGQTVKVKASEKYVAGKGKKRWLGTNYRDVWATEVEVPVFDLGIERGGLTVLKKGGGMQTKSLRLEAANGKQYVLRSIEKYPENAMPVALRKTFARDIVQDQISASHPYGAFIVPTLAEAAQIYHTNPKPVYIPNDPRLGPFQSIFAETLAVYEERPNGEAAGDPFFGGGKDVEGTFDVLEKLQKDNDHSVDQNFVVRNRLFDMWIGDWDRHDDQWRWAEFGKEESGNLYRPIPRDRDQAFFINEGIIPKLASRKWALPKIEGFDESVRWAPGLSNNARYFDRTFMSEPDWDDWKEQIEFLQSNLTDEVIAAAVSGWPDQIQALTADRVTRGLKARRADLERFAREHYLFLSREVEVVGSDKHEYFLVERLNEGDTRVTVHKRKKKGDIENIIYQRVFKSDETKEIRLFGRDGEDVFEIKGASNGKTKIRIIGGTDKDKIINSTGGKLGKLLVYDRKKSTEFDGNSGGISRLSEKPEINAYDRKSFKYDILTPLIGFNVNPDDGIFLGAGFTFVKNAWRKEPLASKHSVNGNVAFATGSFNFSYKGIFTDVVGNWSLSPTVLIQEPFFVQNFFGLGNETAFDPDQEFIGIENTITYYRIRMNRIELDLDLTTDVGAKGKFYFGPGYKSVEVEEQPNRFITNNLPIEGVNFERNSYFKLKTGISVDTRDNKLLPTRGITAMAEIQHFEAQESFSESFTRFSAEWAFYLSAKLPARLVIGNRIGAAHNEGDFEFFNANTLGGWTNFRGVRRTRFYGETSFYHNFDLRLKLFSFRSYIFPAQFGILGFHDVGRVWLDGESSDKWHTGKGFGIWVTPLNSAAISINYAIGEDENLPFIRFGFFF